MKTYYVYILKCSDSTYYIGVTNDLERRLAEHQEGHYPKSYTFSRRPVQLVYFDSFIHPNEAIEFEKQIKGWSRKKKEALIEGNWDRIRELSVCKNGSSCRGYKKGFDSAQPDK